ncbi:hypothetical protein SB719_22760, partial [Pantoea sp. SIMBA_079]|uniref:hypothetical protein n=1 Tax=Pantoea sp. SIMBA_079 TaxID=3085817 RepID=UPI003990F66E
NFESHQIHYTSEFENENGIKYIGEKPIVLLDEDLSGDFKENGVPNITFPYSAPQTYVKNLEPFNEYSGLFPNEAYPN